MGTKKRIPLMSDERIQDVWNVRPIEYVEGELTDFAKLIASGVSRCLVEDSGNRSEISELMTIMLGESVTIQMLDAAASPARPSHPINAHRFLALVAITRRYDILDAVLREIGAKAIDQVDSKIFKLGKAYVTSHNAERDFKQVVSEVFANP